MRRKKTVNNQGKKYIFGILVCFLALTAAAGIRNVSITPNPTQEQSNELSLNNNEFQEEDLSQIETAEEEIDIAINEPENTLVKEDPESSVSASLFDDPETFLYPVSGEIVMDFSLEAPIYDLTLEQYRTNDSICIKSAYGTPVLASADGTIESISMDENYGQTVVVDHLNGWKTTYSQLQDEVPVYVGQSIKCGDTIGYVNYPTKYSTALGNHLNFKISENGVYIDPETALSK